MKQKYKIGNKIPTMRFFKNVQTGEEKLSKSFEIYTTKDFDSLMEEVHENIENNVKEISEKILSNMAVTYA